MTAANVRFWDIADITLMSALGAKADSGYLYVTPIVVLQLATCQRVNNLERNYLTEDRLRTALIIMH